MNYKIAVVGSGISGLGAAWALAKAHNVTLFEKDSRLGGHTNTVTIDCGIDTAVDTGFIVYNEKNYPFLTSFFSHLNVKTIESNMSFAVSLDGGAFEYSSNPINLVSNWRKLNEPRFRNLVRGLIRFYGTDLDCVKGAERLTLREYLEFRRFDKQFKDVHIPRDLGIPFYSRGTRCGLYMGGIINGRTKRYRKGPTYKYYGDFDFRAHCSSFEICNAYILFYMI